MERRCCSLCKQEKPVEEFPPKKRQCKECRRAKKREHYQRPEVKARCRQRDLVTPWFIIGDRGCRTPVILGQALTLEAAKRLAEEFRRHLEGYSAIRLERVGEHKEGR